MAQACNPYEAAFAAWLTERGLPIVSIDERQRRRLGGESTKNLDFIVTTRTADAAPGVTWLIDVKGRRFPTGKSRQYWKNWITRDDLRGLAGWEGQFGPGSAGLIVFAYLLLDQRSPVPADEVFWHRDQPYAFLATRWFEYAAAARVISPRWQTLGVPVESFRRLVRPVAEYFSGAMPATAPTLSNYDPCADDLSDQLADCLSAAD